MRSADGRHAFFRALRKLYGRDLELMASRYSEIRRPALVIHGQRDRLISNRHAERLAQALPEGRLVRIPRCGHFPQEECPDAVAEPLLRFLGQLDGGATAAAPPFSG
jgi:pimeloyl-ACP methyl ester carboxylesterase